MWVRARRPLAEHQPGLGDPVEEAAWLSGYGRSTPQASTAMVQPAGGEGAAVGRRVDAERAAGDRPSSPVRPARSPSSPATCSPYGVLARAPTTATDRSHASASGQGPRTQRQWGG